MEDLTYNMDDDDLFGDVEPVALPGITAAPPKGLVSRLDELSASGNCQYVCLFFLCIFIFGHEHCLTNTEVSGLIKFVEEYSLMITER
jgi:hypothetical protein